MVDILDNDDALNALILVDLDSIIDEVTDKVLGALKEEIDKMVYSDGPPVIYHRYRDEGGLRGAYIRDKVDVNGQTVSSGLDYDPSELFLNQDEEHGIPTHGSDWKGQLWDVRDILADMVINGTSGLRFGMSYWTTERDYWEPFITMLSDGTVDKMIETAFSSRGVEFLKT